ncbi:Aste57867_13568 [Aphanomyces stellatus]|uniref:Aste57867_13568 protein n=1 Tax=Aphanomyces stellatus TaxID=120398 RepID=A0A485L067_9STRA|nr:hypothetical protein As57867_013518 [Aphanomyces stellatus]VFT90406.1 Aste57867_13568 [Aphanomyces stellatus]
MSFRTLQSFSVHPPGAGDLDILPNGIAVTCGEDGYVCFTDVKELKEIRSMRIVTDDGTVPSISVSATLSADGAHRDVFVASSDNYLLNRYSLGAKATFEGCYLRCTEEIKHISCSKSYVAVVSEDLRSRVVVRANMERVLILEGHKEVVKSVAIDPMETFVATSSADGTVKLFNIADVDGETVEVNPAGSLPIRYQHGMDDEVLARIAWQPQTGSLLAVPLQMNTIGLYERGTWKLNGKLVFPTFDGVFNADVNAIAFSPNGHYVVAASMSKQIFVWDVATRECLCSFECEDNVIALSWLVDANGFAVLMSSGLIGHASDVIPASKEPPTNTSVAAPLPVAAPTVEAVSPTPATSTKPDPSVLSTTTTAEDEDEMQVNAIKRSFGFDPDMAVLPAEATIDDDDLDPTTQAAMDAPLLATSSGLVPVAAATAVAQPSFQPGAVLQGPVILLAWNLLGDIEALTSTDQTPLVVLRFNDKAKRGFKFHDTYNLTMADFDDDGAIFAAPAQDDLPSVISYRPIDSWTSSGAWHHSLPEGEDVLCVTTAGSTCAVGTTRQYVRLFGAGGVLLSLFALPGRIVTLASHASGALAVLYAVGGTLHYAVYTVQSTAPRVQVRAQGVLPVAAVEWFGFNDDAAMLFCVQAKTGVVLVLSELVGRQWMPLVNPTHTHGPIFVVGVRDSTVFFLPKILDAPLHLPRKHRPVLSTWSYDRVEEDALWPAQKAAHAIAIDTDDAAMTVPLQAAADKAIILRIKSLCGSDQVQQALDLAACLALEKSHAIVQQIATHFGHRELHKRLVRLEAEAFPHDDEGDDEEETETAPPPRRAVASAFARTSSTREPEQHVASQDDDEPPQAKQTPAVAPAPSRPVRPTPGTFVNPFKKRPTGDADTGDSRKKQK